MFSLAPRSGQGWTAEELNQIARLKEACRSIDWCRLECSHTEEGDPWCVIYDQRDESILFHIARIDRRYVVAIALERQLRRTANMVNAVDLGLERIFVLQNSSAPKS